MKYVETLAFGWSTVRGDWLRVTWTPAYVPIECQQRRCTEHARHKVKGQKRKWKCDKHAGVCIVA